MATDLRNDVQMSDAELIGRFADRVKDDGLDDVVGAIRVEFSEDADGQFAMFITAVIDAEAEASLSPRLVAVTRSLHDAARGLALPVPWYVRVQGTDAAAEDDPTE
jgi:hypothetical protein